jgi:predicted RNA-binding Zn ribbon-like protein
VARWLEHERPVVGDVPVEAVPVEVLRRFRGAVDAVLRATAAGGPLPSAPVAQINHASARVPLRPAIELNGGQAVLAETGVRPPPATDLLARVARSCIQLAAGPDRHRVRACAAPSCGMLFLASRGSQRWCSSACGNRARVARHLRRSRE